MKHLMVLEKEDLNALILEIKEQLVNEIKGNRFVVEKPMRMKEAAEFVGISYRQFQRKVNDGTFKPHALSDCALPFFFPSELVSAIKGKHLKTIL